MLSGGERQRLAFARLFFGEAKIVILDEATSAMDNVTEELVMKNVMEQLKNKTVITIAHRLNTIKEYEKIYVLKKGKTCTLFFIIISATYEGQPTTLFVHNNNIQNKTGRKNTNEYDFSVFLSDSSVTF